MISQRVRGFLETAAIGAAGAGVLTVLQVPAGGLVGAMTAVAIASLCGRPTGFPVPLQALMFMVVGASVGAAATPEAFRSIVTWPASLAILLVSTLAMYAAGYWIFRRFGNCDPVTAFFAAAPGALSAVIVMAESEGAVMSRVASAQALRVAVITAGSPFLLTAFHLHTPAHLAATGEQGWLAWTLLIASAPLGWLTARRLKWPSPAFLGPMALSGALHAAGLLTLSPPRAVVLIASAGLGAMVGTRFRGVNPSHLLSFFPPATASFTVMAMIGLTAGWGAGQLSGVGPMAGMLAFAPGSMDVLIAIALASGQGPAYVAAHHTVRLLGVMAALPWIGPKIRPAATPD